MNEARMLKMAAKIENMIHVPTNTPDGTARAVKAYNNRLKKLIGRVRKKFFFNMSGYTQTVSFQELDEDDDYVYSGKSCGTAGCIAGAVEEFANLRNDPDYAYDSTKEAAQRYLELDDDQANILFEPLGWLDLERITPKQSARAMRRMVKGVVGAKIWAGVR